MIPRLPVVLMATFLLLGGCAQLPAEAQVRGAAPETTWQQAAPLVPPQAKATLSLQAADHSAVVPAAQPVQLPAPRVLEEKPSPFVERTADPQQTIDVIVGIPKLLILKQAPKTIKITGDDAKAILDMLPLGPRELALTGKQVGLVGLNVFFPDPKDPTQEQIATFLIRVLPNTAQEASQLEKLERYYKDIEKKINCAFPNSRVCLQLIGNNVLVTGQAYDAAEATQILRLIGVRQQTQQAVPTTVIQQGLAQTQIQTLPGATPEVPGEVPAPLQPTLLPPTTTPQSQLRLQGMQIVNMLKIPGEQQVMLKVVVAEINRTAARSIGINFSLRNSHGVTIFQQMTGNIAGQNSIAGGSGTGGGGGTGSSTATGGGQIAALANLRTLLDKGEISLVISALKNLNLARSLAEPNLVAINGLPASFQAGGQFPVPVVTGFTAAGLQGVSFVPFGVQLQFTPYITDKDRIRLQLNAEVSTRDTSTGTTVNGANVSGLNTRNFTTNVELREGQTLAIAGLIQNNYGAQGARVPLFGELPVVGRLGAFDQTSSGDQELVVLVTPVLVHPVDAHQRPPVPGEDTFEPTDREFYLGGRLESREPQDYRTTTRTDWWRLWNFRRERPGTGQPTGYPPR